MTTSSIPITSITLALLTVLLTALSLHISRLRIRYQQSFGDGGHKPLMVAVRMHGNALEQSLLFGLLLLAQELMRVPNGWLIGLAATFVVARVMHAVAGFARVLLARQIAHALTVLVQLISVYQLLSLSWRA
jgi:uncharacterized protein